MVLAMRTITFLVRFIGYVLLTIITLWVCLTPLLFILFYTINSNDLIYYLLLPLTLLITWIFGFFAFSILHPLLAVKPFLPPIKPGMYSHKDKLTILMALRLAADGISKYWLKTLEWIPYIGPLFLFPWLLRRYGAKIGKNVYIATDTRIDAPLTTIGSNTFIGNRAVIANHGNHGRKAFFGPVSIGKNCTIGYLSLVPPNVEIGDNVVLGVYSAFKMNSTIPSNTIWVGLPAKKLEKNKKEDNSNDAENN